MWDVTSSGWMRALTDERLEAAVDEGTFARGEAYASRGMVTQAASLNGGRAVVANVDGTQSAPYQTIISLHGDPRDEVLEWSARCSCPVSHDCKHAVAVIISVRDSLTATQAVQAPASWERVLSGLAQEAASEQTDVGAALGLIIESIMVPRDHRDRVGVRRLRVRPTRRTKSGRWSKKFSWQEAKGHSYGYTSVSTRQSHRRAVTAFTTLHAPTISHGYGYQDPAVHLDDFGPEVWPMLWRLRETGVELIGSETGEPVTLDETPTEVVVDVVREAGGLRLRPVVERAGGPGPDPDAGPPDVHLIGRPSHGAAVIDEDSMTLSPFARPLAPGVAEIAQHAEGLFIPEADVERFLALYLSRLRERVTVLSSDGSVDLPEPSPPRLHVRVRGDGPGVRLDLGFAYAVGSQVHVVPAGVGGVLPRDTKGEHTLLVEIEALAELPGATAVERGDGVRLRSPLTFRGAGAIRVMTDVLPLLEDDPRVLLEVDEDAPVYEELDDDPQVTINAAGDESGSDWLDLGVTVTVGDVEVPFEPLFQALVREEEILQLTTGEWFRLDHPVLADLRALIEEARALAEPEAGALRLSRYQVDLWDELVDLAEVDIEREHAWLLGVEALRTLDVSTPPALPAQFTATLRPYQFDGYHWLTTLWDTGLGGVLADDMGLGKTVQALALVARAAEAGDLDEPVLVVAPTSVVGTWASEAARFAPDLDVRVLTQTHKRRGSTVAEAATGAHLVVTSYAVLRIDAEEFAEVRWRGAIIDEAQFVKNSRSKTHQAIRRLSAPFVLVVTGTPLENSLMDLWSMFALAAPGLYPSRETFVEVYRKPIESGAQPQLLDRLRRRIRPLMLRRSKEQVALDLPPKQVQVVPVELTPAHRRLYDRHLQRERKRVLGLLADPDANRVAILASLTRLRQLSLAPDLVDEEHRGQVSSAKIDLLVEHLHELAEEGHRVLVFSQFTRFLGMVRERLAEEGLTTCYLDGSTRDRAAVIDDFRTGEAVAFLISLKAGGVGLTLTEADYVYVLDPWWNPAAEAQAIDRAHRIGQDKPVMVYRLVSSGTIEEKVLALQERKRDLFERVVDDGGALSGRITSDDIRALLDPDD